MRTSPTGCTESYISQPTLTRRFAHSWSTLPSTRHRSLTSRSSTKSTEALTADQLPWTVPTRELPPKKRKEAAKARRLQSLGVGIGMGWAVPCPSAAIEGEGRQTAEFEGCCKSGYGRFESVYIR